MKRICALLICLVSSILSSPALFAGIHTLTRHNLVCDAEFPCPPEISERVDFWIEVFSKFGAKHRIFHDRDFPERIFSVIETADSCSSRGRHEAASIRNERAGVRDALLNLADKVEAKSGVWSETELHLLNLFPEEGRAEDLRRASESIRCQEGNRDRFLGGLQRSGAYRDFVTRALKDAGLPQDIRYLPFVESSYNPKAHSRAGAAGLWQIMPRTARAFGLKINNTLDERYDPWDATMAAIRYLKNSYDRLSKLVRERHGHVENVALGPFVITSYNYGTQGMERALREVGPDYVAVLTQYQGQRFRTAVRNFYASFLAARYVAKNAETIFPGVILDRPAEFETVTLPAPAHLNTITEHFGLTEGALRELNPSLRPRVWSNRSPVPVGHSLRLPKTGEDWKALAAALPQRPTQRVFADAERYRVLPGDTACGIARKFDVPCRDFIDANDLGPNHVVLIGAAVNIPATGSRPPVIVADASVQKEAEPPAAQAVQAEATPEPVTDASPPSRRVTSEPLPSAPKSFALLMERRGDQTIHSLLVEPEETLGHYAEWLGLSAAAPLRTLNRIRDSRTLSLGQKVRLPIKSEEQREAFVKQRAEYHAAIEEDFRQHYTVTGTESITIRRGDTPWEIARRHGVPLWLLGRTNPAVFTSPLRAGDSLEIQIVEKSQPD